MSGQLKKEECWTGAKVQGFNNKRGYGFIRVAGLSNDVFFFAGDIKKKSHRKQMKHGTHIRCKVLKNKGGSGYTAKEIVLSQ